MKSNVKKSEVTLLLPVYNEANTIENIILEFYKKIGKNILLKIMVVEDGSTDGTKEILQSLSKRMPIKLFLRKERRGYSKALKYGLKKVDTKFVVCMDSDGQHFPEDFWKLFRFRDKYHVVIGCRVKRCDNLFRRIMSITFQKLARFFFGLPFQDVTGPYRLIDTSVAKELANKVKYMEESFWTEFTVRAYKKGFKILETPVRHRKALSRSTNVYKPFKIPNIAFSQLIGLIKLWLERK